MSIDADFKLDYWHTVATDEECHLKYCCPHRSVRYRLIDQGGYYLKPEPVCVDCERTMLLHIQFGFHRDVKFVGCDCDETSLRDAAWKRGYHI